MKSLIIKAISASRPISWINTAFPFAATYIFVSKEIDWYLIVGTLFFILPYNLLMYGVNDVFDYESDKNNPRKGSVEGAILDKSIHRRILQLIALVNLPVLAILLSLSTTESAIALLLVVFMAFAYSAPPFRFKEIPVMDSITSSSHFVGPMVVALVHLNGVGSALPALASFFMWGFASHAYGAVQDIVPDRRANIASIATYFGARKTIIFSLVLYSISALTLIFWRVEAILPGLTGLAYVANCINYIGISDAQSAKVNSGWKKFIYLNLVMGFVITIVLILNF